MPAFSENAHTGFLVDRDRALPIGANPFKLGVRNANRTSLQWIVHQAVVGASALIDIYVADTDREAPDLDILTPANPYWSPLENTAGVPITFPHLPGAVAGSCLIPIGLLSLTSLLVVVTVAGAEYPLGSFSLLARTTG